MSAMQMRFHFGRRPGIAHYGFRKMRSDLITSRRWDNEQNESSPTMQKESIPGPDRGRKMEANLPDLVS